MPASVFDVAVSEALDAATMPREVPVRVGDRRVPVPCPFPSPQDWRDVWIYHLMLDRFNNPDRPPRRPWNRKCLEFQGGTFNGLRRQLDYLKDLGAGAIWLSPFMKNCQYLSDTFHGYGIQDFLRLDPRFASTPGAEEEEFLALVRETHARGLYVIADIVLNHAGNVFQYDCDGDPQCVHTGGAEAGGRGTEYRIFWRDETGRGRPDWTEPPDDPGVSRDALLWPRELQQNRYFRRKGLGGEASGDFASLKELVTGDPAVRDVLIRSHLFLIAKYDVDGFRIDTLKYIERDFARIFGNAIREYGLRIGKKNFLTYGEVWDTEEKIAEFIGRYAREGGDLVGVDAALDFPLFERLPSMAKGFTPPVDVIQVFQRRREVQREVISSHGEASRFFVTFLDNHDQKRRFRNTRLAEFDDQVSLGLGCLFSLQGIPCVYYGTEQGLNGTEEVYEPNAPFEDWMVREALWGKGDAFSREHQFCRVMQRLTQVRNDHPALRYGRQYFRPISGNRRDFGVSQTPQGVLAFSRILSDDEIVVVANTQSQAGWSGYVIVDASLNTAGSRYEVAFSNKPEGQVAGPDPVETVEDVVIQEVGGGTSYGPAGALRVHLQRMEIQILRRRA